jgi:hypothetical protein
VSLSPGQVTSFEDKKEETDRLRDAARLVQANASTVRRLNRRFGEDEQAFHEACVQADERHGYAGDKGQYIRTTTSAESGR